MLILLIGGLLMVLPLRWAAIYSEAANATYLNCIICIILNTLFSSLVEFLIPSSPLIAQTLFIMGFAYICTKILAIPSANNLMFMVIYVLLFMILAFVSRMFLVNVFG